MKIIAKDIKDLEKKLKGKLLKGDPGQDAVVDYEKIIKTVLDKVEIPKPEVPSLEEISESVLSKIKMPTIIVPNAEEVAIALKEKGLVKDGINGDPGKSVEIDDVIQAVLDIIEIPEPEIPTVDEIADCVLSQIKIPEPGSPPSKDEVIEGVMQLIKLPEPEVPSIEDIAAKVKLPEVIKGDDGKDSPLSQLYEVISGTETILGESNQVILDHKLQPGFLTVTVQVKGYTADLSAAFDDRTEYLLLSKNNTIQVLQTRPDKAVYSLNNQISAQIEFKDGRLVVSANGLEDTEATWAVSLFIHK